MKSNKCPTIDDCIKKLWYVYTMEYYSSIKKPEIMSFAGKWMELEINMLSVISQAQKTNIICLCLYVESRPK
jgi:hypothetical protein